MELDRIGRNQTESDGKFAHMKFCSYGKKGNLDVFAFLECTWGFPRYAQITDFFGNVLYRAGPVVRVRPACPEL